MTSPSRSFCNSNLTTVWRRRSGPAAEQIAAAAQQLQLLARQDRVFSDRVVRTRYSRPGSGPTEQHDNNNNDDETDYDHDDDDGDSERLEDKQSVKNKSFRFVPRKRSSV